MILGLHKNPGKQKDHRNYTEFNLTSLLWFSFYNIKSADVFPNYDSQSKGHHRKVKVQSKGKPVWQEKCYQLCQKTNDKA